MNGGISQIIAGGVIAIVSSALAWWGALRLQERADIQRIRDAAQALLEDVGRIRRTLVGPTAAGLGPIGEDLPSVPQLHPWLHGLVPVIAAASGAALRGLLQLDEDLSQRAVLVERYGASIAARRTSGSGSRTTGDGPCRTTAMA